MTLLQKAHKCKHENGSQWQKNYTLLVPATTGRLFIFWHQIVPLTLPSYRAECFCTLKFLRKFRQQAFSQTKIDVGVWKMPDVFWASEKRLINSMILVAWRLGSRLDIFIGYVSVHNDVPEQYTS